MTRVSCLAWSFSSDEEGRKGLEGCFDVWFERSLESATRDESRVVWLMHDLKCYMGWK